MLNKVIVNGKPILELIGETLIFEGRDTLREISGLPTHSAEIPFYKVINDKVDKYWKYTTEERPSRRHLIFLDECITSFQFLLERTPSVLIVTMRSSSFFKLKGDIAFFAQHALAKNCDKLIINIGSLHVIVGEED